MSVSYSTASRIGGWVNPGKVFGIGVALANIVDEAAAKMGTLGVIVWILFI
jgi:hypothetical protein